jgi:hypothetical protein
MLNYTKKCVLFVLSSTPENKIIIATTKDAFKLFAKVFFKTVKGSYLVYNAKRYFSVMNF